MKKKLLVLTPRFPYPVLSGDKVRIYHLCRELSKRFRITLLSLCTTEEECTTEVESEIFAEVHRIRLPAWRSWIQSLGALFSRRPLQLAYFWSPKYRRRVEELFGCHDLVLAHLLRAGQYCLPLMDDHGTPAVLEMTDAISRMYGRTADHGSVTKLMHLVYRVEAKRIRRTEVRMCQTFELVTLVSEHDRLHLRDQLGCDESVVRVYPNGVSLSRFPYLGPGDTRRIVFIGDMHTVQNRDACDHFVGQVLPRVREKAPEAIFRIIGTIPDGVRERYERHEGVETTGRVDNVARAADGAACAVCPVRIKAGIQNKVLEYLALGLPCVVSRVALEGLEAVPDRDLLVSGGPEEMADAVLRLLSDEEERERLARSGRSFVEEKHRWSAVLAPLADDLEALAEA